MTQSASPARLIPAIERIRQDERARALERQYGAVALVAALRDEASALRARLAAGAEPAVREGEDAARLIIDAAAARLARIFRPSLSRVINATGVVIHTNLGRAPLSAAAARRVAEIAAGYSNLEYDLDRGARGSRARHAEPALCRVTGAEAAAVVNNNAAATLLVLAALAAGREVVISRGELVEIGGGFRVPDVMAQSGARLREVGTTNRTRVADYAAAIGHATALILRVHPSNFRIEGFTERPELKELVALGRQLEVPVCEDLGSGNLLAGDRTPVGAADEPRVQASLAAGADLVWFSGDKMLGGPQAGIIVGRRALVDRIRKHPLMRALRADKMTYAALEATLADYERGEAGSLVPVARMIGLSADEIGRRAEALRRSLAESTLEIQIADGVSTIGGGSAPGAALPTRVLEVSSPGRTADALGAALRALDPPVIARIDRDRVVIDLRTVLPEEDELLAGLLRGLLA